MIGEDGAQMVLDICTRISLGAVVSDEVAVLLEMGRHRSSVSLVPGDKNLFVQTANWVCRLGSIGTGHSKPLSFISLEVAKI
jgi:hypothetical protein